MEPQRLKRPGEAEIKILTSEYHKKETLGEKRNRLLDMASGDYICFIDDDDMVPEYYIDSLLTEIHEHNPDAIGWWQSRYKDGTFIGYSVHSIACCGYSREYDNDTKCGTVFYRPPNHLNAVKSELAKNTAFQRIDKWEDIDYTMRLLPKLKTERFIPKFMYTYYYVTPGQRAENLTISQRQNTIEDI